jgi:hypothetical protein
MKEREGESETLSAHCRRLYCSYLAYSRTLNMEMIRSSESSAYKLQTAIYITHTVVTHSDPALQSTRLQQEPPG